MKRWRVLAGSCLGPVISQGGIIPGFSFETKCKERADEGKLLHDFPDAAADRGTPFKKQQEQKQ